MVDWTLLEMEESIECEKIHTGFTTKAIKIEPDKNSSQYRRLFATYKEALRNAIRQQAINSGKKAQDLDFDFSDARYLPEFLQILDNLSTNILKNSLIVWKTLIEDSDYRNLQRTDEFMVAFDEKMSEMDNLSAKVWEYLINHFSIYGFSAQNKNLVANLKIYGNIKDKTQTKIMTEIPHSQRIKSQVTQAQVTQTHTAQPQVTQTQNVVKQPVQNQLLQQYLKLQDESITQRFSSEFFVKFDRVYSHDFTKNNMSAWRYLFQDEKYITLMKQVHFVEKLANRMKNIYDLYPAIWQYIIDKTKVPESHPMYQKTTGYLINLSKSNAFKGTVLPQPIIPIDTLGEVIDEDNYIKGHHDNLSIPKQNTVNWSTKKKSNSSGVVKIIIFIVVIWWIFINILLH